MKSSKFKYEFNNYDSIKKKISGAFARTRAGLFGARYKFSQASVGPLLRLPIGQT